MLCVGPGLMLLESAEALPKWTSHIPLDQRSSDYPSKSGVRLEIFDPDLAELFTLQFTVVRLETWKQERLANADSMEKGLWHIRE